MGGASALTFLFGILRNKAAAVFIGASGFGFLSALSVLQGVVGVLFGLGIQMSAVREIAATSGSGDEKLLSKTVLAVRRVSWISGILGMLVMAIMSPFLSQITFGERTYAPQIAVLSIVILLGNLNGARSGLIQGLRQIGVLAKVNVVGFTLSTVVAVLLFSRFGFEGIVPALIIGSVVQLSVTWWFSRKIRIVKVQATWLDSFRLSGGLLRLGLTFMWSTLITSIVALAINAAIARELSLEALGLYGAAFAVSGMFINFVLRAMGADFYPRLASVSEDNDELNRLVNEQTEVGLLLILPGMLATVGFTPWILKILYTDSFLPAAPLIQWFVLGVMLRVASWPLGFVLRAIGDEKKFFFTETLFQTSHLLFAVMGMVLYGLEGAAFGFFLMNGFTLVVIFPVVRSITGFSWARHTWRLLCGSYALLLFLILASQQLSELQTAFVGSVCVIFSGIFSLHAISGSLGPENLLIKVIRKIPGVRFILSSSPVA